ncbi:MAG: hypothetical protein JJ892_03965 [Balneola sp.]|nr:hypothetical protein [Balneola sp.]MBO6651607.1 hypothetical protein [Balneola sp.]MBO6710727.1 hypothetical protein [Balneola sp.]MBO6799413.1 hypothetical protein [Balneola sp.]MBO6869458.1 hypothetical protein [Balneola sp.]
MKYFPGIALMSIILLTIACSGASEVTNKNTSANNALYPAWYGAMSFLQILQIFMHGQQL